MNEQEARQILEVNIEAGQNEIRRSYKQLMMIWHPDRFTDDDLKRRATIQTQKLIDAFDLLSKSYREEGLKPNSAESEIRHNQKGPKYDHTDECGSPHLDNPKLSNGHPASNKVSLDQRNQKIPF